jgi:hypothetical protein
MVAVHAAAALASYLIFSAFTLATSWGRFRTMVSWQVALSGMNPQRAI